MRQPYVTGVRFRRSFNGARRKPQLFDPSELVKNAKQTPVEPVVEQAVTSKFTDFGFHEVITHNILSKGYVTPTPIQDRAISHILDGRDVIGIANTGTGKTAAFLMPMLHRMLANVNSKTLIIAPTRELAAQIRQECIEFARGTHLRAQLCIGGTPMFRQKKDLLRNPRIIIGTPGRIKDLADSRNLNLSTFDTVVLDEVDQMVDIGFIHDIKHIVSLLAPQRQSLFFSATLDGKVREILSSFVSNPVTVSVKKQDVLSNIKHDVVRVRGQLEKVKHLVELLNKDEYKKVLIFGRTKWGVQRLSDDLVKRGFSADALHGDKRQSQRLRIIDRFKRDDIKILFATDVAARGLDIDNVSHVINFDAPESYEVYIHRIGRTGRAHKGGTAITFV